MTALRYSSSFILFVSCLLLAKAGYAQHTKREIAFTFAYAGQLPIVQADGNTQGFYAKPLIASLRYQVATDYVQALSITLEYVMESRENPGLWNDNPSMPNAVYNANIDERLTMTMLGLEGVRTLISNGSFRLGAGFGIGYGLGGATAMVTKISNGSVKTYESSDIWNGFEVQAFIRGRYTIVQTDKIDLGILGNIRYWGFPTIGPLSTTSSSYNGPAFRSLHEMGYSIGVSVGF